MSRSFSLSRRWCVAALALAACGGGETIVAAGGSTLSGHVVLQDAWGNTLADAHGVEVSVDGVPTTAVTDASGGWTLDGIPNGAHDVRLTKQGFGPMRILEQQVSGEATAPTIAMALTPSVQAIIDSVYPVSLEGTDFYFVDGHYSAPPPNDAQQSVVVLLVGRDAKVSPDPATYEQWNIGIYLGGSTPTFSVGIPVLGTRNTFGGGSTLFIAGYATSATCSCYVDPSIGKRVFTNTGPRSNVVTFKIP